MKHPILTMEELSDEFYQVSGLDLPKLSRSRIWIFDLEATGLDTTLERVTQIAGIPLEGGVLLDEQSFTQLVYPGDGVEIPKVVEDLTGITMERLEGAPLLPEAWAACVEAAGAADLWMGQSVFEFDVPLPRNRVRAPRHARGVASDPGLRVLASALLGEPEGRWSTTALLERFSIDVGKLRRHDALDDVKILGLILLPLLERLKRKHGDRLTIPASNPLRIRRHPRALRVCLTHPPGKENSAAWPKRSPFPTS